MKAAEFDINWHIIHISGKENKIADLLSRWDGSHNHLTKLKQLLADHVWLKVASRHMVVDDSI